MSRHCPARVAKIGRKDHAPEPLRGSAWRRQIKDLARSMLMCLAVVIVAAVTVGVMK